MTRRMMISLAALLGVIGVLLAPAAGQAAPAHPAASLVVAVPAPAAHAQIGFPGFFDIGALLQSIFNSFPPFLQRMVGPIFASLLQLFTGGCVGSFCASP